jgi:hypothetical protein
MIGIHPIRINSTQCLRQGTMGVIGMDELDQKLFMEAQCEEIRKHKWIESEKAGYDVGQEASLDWIKQSAKKFREHVIKSGKYRKKKKDT